MWSCEILRHVVHAQQMPMIDNSTPNVYYMRIQKRTPIASWKVYPVKTNYLRVRPWHEASQGYLILVFALLPMLVSGVRILVLCSGIFGRGISPFSFGWIWYMASCRMRGDMSHRGLSFPAILQRPARDDSAWPNRLHLLKHLNRSGQA